MSPDFQRVSADFYDIDLVSPPPHGATEPEALNSAVSQARADHVLICGDGPRLFSTGILRSARLALRMNPRGLMAVHGLALKAGAEDGLDQAGFPDAPHAIWSLSDWDASSRDGFFAPMSECWALLMSKAHFQSIGGYDGAGAQAAPNAAHADLYARAVRDRSHPLFIPLAEGVFRGPYGAASGLHRVTSEDRVAFERATGRPFARAEDRPVQYFSVMTPDAVAPKLKGAVDALADKHAARWPREAADLVSRAMAAETPPPAASPPNKLVLVAGMHRSGTSFLTRQFVRNGYAVPGQALQASAVSNPDGHFEPTMVIAFHNAVFRALFSTWHGLRPMPWDDPSELARLSDALARVLAALPNEGGANWVIKDPRICRMTPLWDTALAALGWTARRVVILRDPSLVAKSLMQRDGMPMGQGLLLWARHVLGAWRWVADPADVLCLDQVTTSEFSLWLSDILGNDARIEAVRGKDLPDASDPITLAYRDFVQTRDAATLIDRLQAELAFADRYGDYVQNQDWQGRFQY